MARKKKTERSASELATELLKVRSEIAPLKLLDTSLTRDLKEALHREQIKYAGNYKLSEKITLKVVEPETAFQWAATTNCLKIDTTKAKEILRHTFEEPEKFGFERVSSEAVIPITGGVDEE